MELRRCNAEDFDAIYEIEKKSFADPLKEETVKKGLREEKSFYYALFDNGRAVAFMCYEKVFEEAQIISVAVHPDMRKKGYGKKLFEKVIECSKKDGVELFTLEVRGDNTAATALYKSMGFEKVGMRKNYYTNPVCDALLMDLKIGKD